MGVVCPCPGWQKQGHAGHVVPRTYRSKVGLIDVRIRKKRAKKKKKGKRKKRKEIKEGKEEKKRKRKERKRKL